MGCRVLSLGTAALCLAGVLMTKVASAQRRVHVDDIVISGRFLYEAADSTGLDEPVLHPFTGTLFDLWPNGALKSECVIEDGEWGFNCQEWHLNGQLRSEEVFDPPYVLWNGWYPDGEVFFQKRFAFEEPLGPFIGVGEELDAKCFTPDGALMPCPEEILWPGESE